MLDEYKKVKDIFKKPTIKVYFGFWSTPKFIIRLGNYLVNNQDKNDTFKYKIFDWIHTKLSCSDPGLPVWRHGNTFNIFKKHQTYDYNKREYVWNQDFENKLEKIHLSWLKPSYELPNCLSFYFFKWDMCWKWKYDEVRYEFPPQITLVLFNVSISLYWRAPKTEDGKIDDLMYWESILNYTHKYKETLRGKNVDELSQILGLSDYCGYWSSFNKETDTYDYIWTLQPTYLRDKEYAKILKERQELRLKEIIERAEKLRCPKCGKRMHLADENVVLLTNPPKYEYVCNCGEHKYLTEKIENYY